MTSVVSETGGPRPIDQEAQAQTSGAPNGTGRQNDCPPRVAGPAEWRAAAVRSVAAACDRALGMGATEDELYQSVIDSIQRRTGE